MPPPPVRPLGARPAPRRGPAATASAGPDEAAYVDATVAAWQGGDPVYVSPDSGALGDEDADALRDRITGWRDDVFVAVLPAKAIRQGDGADVDEASALLDELYDGMGRVDGIYVVNLSGAGTYAAGYGDAPGAIEVGRIVADQVEDHTLGQVDQILDGTLDELGAPDAAASPRSGWSWRCSSVPRRPPPRSSPGCAGAGGRGVAPPARPGPARPTTGRASRRTATSRTRSRTAPRWPART